ncbi:MerR family transcriptional regulator [Thalassococcus sp. CAU 1522]|uniref:MerR family transcriptional regulator n=1 Tax=Thalassococcus arenae TaxID=2851652 RepID=A0ABS6N9R4_9RHOB|nr:MerR family transcriptional regulator [Thalassococcus arenae]MBV2360755.1 MerR family transcriptional regulator [Thalassococcus arenae]
MAKSRDAFRTISEVAEWLDTPAHVLRFWESKFTQIKPVKRAGGRRYYRPNDMELLGGIKKLLHEDGMTIKGAQKVLREQGVKYVAGLSTTRVTADPEPDTLVEDAPYVEVESPETVVPFARAEDDGSAGPRAGAEIEQGTDPAETEAPQADDDGRTAEPEAETDAVAEAAADGDGDAAGRDATAEDDLALPDFLKRPDASEETPPPAPDAPAVQPRVPDDPDIDAITAEPGLLGRSAALSDLPPEIAHAVAEQLPALWRHAQKLTGPVAR